MVVERITGAIVTGATLTEAATVGQATEWRGFSPDWPPAVLGEIFRFQGVALVVVPVDAYPAVALIAALMIRQVPVAPVLPGQFPICRDGAPALARWARASALDGRCGAPGAVARLERVIGPRAANVRRLDLLRATSEALGVVWPAAILAEAEA